VRHNDCQGRTLRFMWITFCLLSCRVVLLGVCAALTTASCLLRILPLVSHHYQLQPSLSP